MEYRFLTRADLGQAFVAYARAFAEYVSDFSRARDEFDEMVRRRGLNPECSAGAFIGGALVAFALTSLDSWQGVPTAYDFGCGVVPEYRGHGLLQGVFRLLVPRLRRIGIRLQLVEVLRTNQLAADLYRMMGYRIQRRLDSFRRSAPLDDPLAPQLDDLVLSLRDEADWPQFQTFWDWVPTWQNGPASIERAGYSRRIVVALLKGKCVGYGIFFPRSGDIAQLAVHRDFRRRGIASAILCSLPDPDTAPRSLQAMNIDHRAQATADFYTRHGFDPYIGQYEMSLPL